MGSAELPNLSQTALVNYTLTINSRGMVKLPAELLHGMGVKAGGQLIAETGPEGLLLRPCLALPIELYVPERTQEFDIAEAELAAQLSKRRRPSKT